MKTIFIDEKTGKSKGYAFVTVPIHISEESMKLNNDIEFNSKNLVIDLVSKKPSEQRKFTSKTRPESVEQPKPGPSNTKLIQPKRLSPEKIGNSEADIVSPNVIFSDSMVKGLKTPPNLVRF